MYTVKVVAYKRKTSSLPLDSGSAEPSIHDQRANLPLMVLILTTQACTHGDPFRVSNATGWICIVSFIMAVVIGIISVKAGEGGGLLFAGIFLLVCVGILA